ncbi:MAG: hypothetical protein LBP72_09120 [Dysgonamonadaceae bacterium]|jgi:hypothetical protein|nr:hypothetical protein [Dysgonamonadaceae bacterium]
MTAIKNTRGFIKNGVSVFSDASKGIYRHSFPEIESIKSEILNKEFGSFAEDRKNMISDRKMIASDVRKVFSEI